MRRFFIILRLYLVMAVTAVFLSLGAFAETGVTVFPNTGDEFKAIYAIIAAVAVVGFIAVIFLTKPKKKDDGKDKKDDK